MKKKVVLAFFIFFVGALLPILFQQNEEVLSLVTVDINPSVGLLINEDYEIVEVLPLNEDATIAVEGLELVGQDIEKGLEDLVDTAIEMGYIDELSEENLINLTTYIDDETKNEELNERLIRRANRALERASTYGLVISNGLDEELKAKADTYDISYGKMLLISRAMLLDSTAIESELASYSIKEIQAIIKTEAIEIRAQAKKTHGDDFSKIKEDIIDAAVFYKKQGNVLGNDDLTREEIRAIIEAKKLEIKEHMEETKESIENGDYEEIDRIKERIKDKLNQYNIEDSE